MSDGIILRGRWRRQFIVILGFFLFDYVSTTVFCKNPTDEWNIIARALMIGLDSVPIGMTVFFLMIGALWYLVICLISRFADDAKKSGRTLYYRALLMCNFMSFAFVAAWDFGFGATSWFWPVPIFYRALVGLVIYTAGHFLWIDRATPN